MGDTEALITIACIFITMGIIMPFINSEFSTNAAEPDIDNFGNEITADINKASSQSGLYGAITIGDVLLSILGMFTWTFGGLPALLDAFLLIPRVIMVWLIAKLIRGTG